MNSKRYRKRKSGVVPISSVKLRESHHNRGVIARHRRKCYPLFETWNDIYNFTNLMESIKDWNDYSTSEIDNVKQTGVILEEIGKHGTINETLQAALVISEDVLSYLDQPGLYKNYFSKLKGVDEAVDYILDKIYLFEECDRVASNYKLLKEKYDMNKLFKDSWKYFGLDETMFRLCDLMEEYNIEDFPTRFCITVENALYGLSNLMQESEIPKQSIVEAIIDYHLIHDGCNDTKEYFKQLREAYEASDFIPNYVEPYIQLLESVESDKERNDLLEEHFSNPAIQAIAEYDHYHYMENSYMAFCEENVLDSAKEWIAKLKMAPVKSIGLVKEAVRSVLVTRRIQDIDKGTRNALAIAFYIIIIAGFASFGAIPAILGMITSYLLHQHLSKTYLKSAIKEWTNHKYSVKEKLAHAKNANQRRVLEKYLSEVEKNIELLSEEYEKERDATAQEISDKQSKYNAYKPNSSSITVDPTGKETPYANVEKNENKSKGVYDFVKGFVNGGND